MKLIIEIDNKAYKGLVNEGHIFVKHIFDAVKNGTPIPDNATNGDVIKAMFPNTSLHINEMSHTVWVGYEEMSFRIDWWNSPYQKGSK